MRRKFKTKLWIRKRDEDEFEEVSEVNLGSVRNPNRNISEVAFERIPIIDDRDDLEDFKRFFGRRR